MSKKTKKFPREWVGKEIAVLVGRGDECTCADCPVLYGAECPTTQKVNKQTK